MVKKTAGLHNFATQLRYTRKLCMTLHNNLKNRSWKIPKLLRPQKIAIAYSAGKIWAAHVNFCPLFSATPEDYYKTLK